MNDRADKDLPDPEAPLDYNPFYNRGPIRDPRYLFGRTNEIRQALQLLRHEQCVSIVGPRRIGKTSLLHHCCDPIVQQPHGLGENCLSVYVDCQGLEFVEKSRFYHWLWRETQRWLTRRGDTEGWVEGVSGFEDFREAMTAVQERGYRLTFLFDEFESLATSQEMDESLFASLRSLYQQFQVTYVTASRMPVDELTLHDNSVLDSPFLHDFQVVHLGFLEREEAVDMVYSLLDSVEKPGLFTQHDLEFVFDSAGYHPFFLQLICYHLFERKTEGTEMSAKDYADVRWKYIEDAERFFQYIWRHSKQDEQQAIKLISGGQIHRVSDEQCRELERRCILDGDAFFCSAFAEFMHRQPASTPLAPEMVAPETVAQEGMAQRRCKLSLICSKRNYLSTRITGSLSYEAESELPLEGDLAARMARRALIALKSSEWRYSIREIGMALFDELFVERREMLTGYERASGHVEQAALSLAFHTPRDLFRLPFEALYTEDDGHLCLKYPMSRVISGRFFKKGPPSAALLDELTAQGEPRRALVVASNTWTTSERAEGIPSVEREVDQVRALLEERGFDVCALSTGEATEARVRHELEHGDYMLFHYAGHGVHKPGSPEESALYFWEGAKGTSALKSINASQLEGLVRDTPLHFVYLSGCWGARSGPPDALLEDDFLGVMDGLVMGGVPAVLGFRWPVSDGGARALAHQFYSTWLDEEQRDLSDALLEARQAVADQYGRDKRDWFSPVLVVQG